MQETYRTRAQTCYVLCHLIRLSSRLKFQQVCIMLEQKGMWIVKPDICNITVLLSGLTYVVMSSHSVHATYLKDVDSIQVVGNSSLALEPICPAVDGL